MYTYVYAYIYIISNLYLTLTCSQMNAQVVGANLLHFFVLQLTPRQFLYDHWILSSSTLESSRRNDTALNALTSSHRGLVFHISGGRIFNYAHYIYADLLWLSLSLSPPTCMYYIYVYICIYIWIYIHVYLCIYVSMCIRIYVNMYLCIYVNIYTFMCTCVYIYM